MSLKQEIFTKIYTLEARINNLKKSVDQNKEDVILLNEVINIASLIKQDAIDTEKHCKFKLRYVDKFEDKQFELFKKDIENTTFKSYSLIPNPYPETEEEYAKYESSIEAQKVVNQIQKIILDEVEREYNNLKYKSYFDATNIIYDTIEPRLSECADKYGITDTAVRESICYRIDKFFKAICVG